MLTALLAAAALTASADPLAPAAAGQVQCYHPNVERHTCRSIAAYTPNGDGSWTNTSTVLVSKRPELILRTSAQVREQNGAVCGQIHASDLTSGTLTLNGQEMPAEDAAPLLAQAPALIGKALDRDICTTWQGDGQTTAAATVDGEAHPELNQTVMWVSPSDYHVGP